MIDHLFFRREKSFAEMKSLAERIDSTVKLYFKKKKRFDNAIDIEVNMRDFYCSWCDLCCPYVEWLVQSSDFCRV